MSVCNLTMRLKVCQIFLCVVVPFFLCPTLQSVNSAVSPSFYRTDITKEVRMGVLLPREPENCQRPTSVAGCIPKYPYFLQMVVPAVEIALEYIKEILPNHNLSLVINDTKCDMKMTQILAVDHFYKYFIDVFIGPACEYNAATVERFAEHWNVPFVTAGGNARGLDNKGILTRVGTPYTRLRTLVHDYAHSNKWHTIAVLLHEKGATHFQDYSFLCSGIFGEAESFTVVPISFNQAEEECFEEELETVKSSARGELQLLLNIHEGAIQPEEGERASSGGVGGIVQEER